MSRRLRPSALYTVTLVAVTAAATTLFQACGGGGGDHAFGNAIAATDAGAVAAAPDPIIGVWNSTATIKDCNSGAVAGSFTGFATFNSGGTAIFANSRPPASQSSGMGTWKRADGNNYTLALIFMRFNADGTLAGTQTAKVSRTLSDDGNSYTGVISGQVIDLNGKVIATTCATDAGSRVTW